MNILVIDCGTTSIRGILFSQQGRQVFTGRIHAPLIRREGRIEQTPEFYANALTRLCADAAQTGGIDAVALTAFRSAPTLLDGQGVPLHNFIMWQDTRSQDICRELSGYDPLLRQKCGAHLNTVFAGSKWTWLKRNCPELWEKAERAVVVPDYLLHLMSGRYQTDRTYASRTFLMDLETGQWDAQLCRIFSVEPQKLCELVEPGTQVGTVTARFARRSGLPAGIPVITAGGDQQCAALGLGLTGPGPLAVNLGTGGYVMALSGAAADVDDAVCNRSALPGYFLVETSLPSCAPAFQDYLASRYPEFHGEIGRLDHLVRTGADPEAQKFYEDMAGRIAQCIQTHPAGRERGEPVYLAGGVSGNDVFAAMLARAAGRRLIRWRDPEATAIGAFVSAAVCLGIFPDAQQALAAARGDDARTVFEG